MLPASFLLPLPFHRVTTAPPASLRRHVIPAGLAAYVRMRADSVPPFAHGQAVDNELLRGGSYRYLQPLGA